MRPLSWCSSIVLLYFSASLSYGQDPKVVAVQREAMKKLDFFVGQWRGESWIEFTPGQRRQSQGTETVQSKLGGLLLTMDGIHERKAGQRGDGTVSHNAFAVISYDEKAQRYRFHAHTAMGSYAEADASVVDGSLVWSMHVPRLGQVRYTIKLNDKGQWFEIGETSPDGKTWQKFFEMTLDRVKE
jgi:hypothetical protein